MNNQDLFLWPDANANLRRNVKLRKADLDDEALDDLNGLSPWEDAFWRGEKSGKSPDRGGSYEA